MLVPARRTAVGFGLLGAVVVLWPLAAWSWPVLVVGAIGLGGLVLVRVLRLDRLLLRGWWGPLCGLAVLVALAQGAPPWAWGLATGAGVVVAGLLRLRRWWWLAAAGAALCAISATALVIGQYRTAEQAAAQQVQTQLESRGRLGAPRPTALLPALLTTIARGETGAVCDALLAERTHPAFAASAGAPDCVAAVRALAARVTDPGVYAQAHAPTVRRDRELDVDACRMTWRGGTVPGPQLGHLTVGPVEGGTTYVVTELRPC
jgi:hypothetical protein